MFPSRLIDLWDVYASPSVLKSHSETVKHKMKTEI